MGVAATPGFSHSNNAGSGTDDDHMAAPCDPLAVVNLTMGEEGPSFRGFFFMLFFSVIYVIIFK
jgi:hypothetical protein